MAHQISHSLFDGIYDLDNRSNSRTYMCYNIWGCWSLILNEVVLLCMRWVLEIAIGAISRRCIYVAKLNLHRAPTADIEAPMHKPQCIFITFAPSKGGISHQVGLILALKYLHRMQRTTSIARRWGQCLACIDGAFGCTGRELCSACAVRLDPCLAIMSWLA